MLPQNADVGCYIKISCARKVAGEPRNSHVNMATPMLEGHHPQAWRGHLLHWKTMSFRRETAIGDRELREKISTLGEEEGTSSTVNRVVTT